MRFGYAGRQVDDGGGFHFARNFRQELEIYYFHRVTEISKKLGFLFLVPDILDVWQMYQAGIENVVCCFDEVPSQAQINLLLPPKVEEGEREQRALWLMTYNDLDCEEFLKMFIPLAEQFFIKVMFFEDPISDLHRFDFKNFL